MAKPTAAGAAKAEAPTETRLLAGPFSDGTMAEFGQAMARASQSIAANQAVLMGEAIDDLTALMRQAASSSSDPAAASRACAAYVEAAFRRTLAHWSVCAEAAAELSASALQLAGRRFAAQAQASHEPDPSHTPGKA